MVIKDYIKNSSIKFNSLCEKHQVKRLYAFGSSVTNNFSKESDIDLLIELEEEDPLKKGEMLLSFWNEMENFFRREVDLLTPSSISNPILEKSIKDTKVLLYDESAEKIYN